MENDQIEEPEMYNDPADREGAEDQLLTQMLYNYERARRVIEDLERGLRNIANIDVYGRYPDADDRWPRALGYCEGEALVALCSIPREWQRIAKAERITRLYAADYPDCEKLAADLAKEVA